MTIVVSGIFCMGFAIGEHQHIKKMRAAAECPDGNVERKVVDLVKMEVRCTYFRKGKQ